MISSNFSTLLMKRDLNIEFLKEFFGLRLRRKRKKEKSMTQKGKISLFLDQSFKKKILQLILLTFYQGFSFEYKIYAQIPQQKLRIPQQVRSNYYFFVQKYIWFWYFKIHPQKRKFGRIQSLSLHYFYNNFGMKKALSLKNFRKMKTNKWQTKEQQYLMKLYVQLAPTTPLEWDHVCTNMHEVGSRRSLKEYKAKTLNMIGKIMQKQANLEKGFKDKIYRQFQQGKHPNQILQDLSISWCNSYKIRNILKYKFNSINTHLKKIVGVSKVTTITIDDHQLFKFIKEQKLQLLSFQAFSQLVVRWKQTKVGKNFGEMEVINDKFKAFNNNLHLYKEMYGQSKRQLPDRKQLVNPQSLKKDKPLRKTSTFLSSTLSLVCKKLLSTPAETTYQFQNLQNLKTNDDLPSREEQNNFFEIDSFSSEISIWNPDALILQPESSNYWKF